jgi:hypothetical protein
MGRRRKKKRRQSPLQVAKKIATNLRNLGIRGRFDIEEMHIPTDSPTYWGNPTGPDFFWLASAQPTWLEFRVKFRPTSTQEIESLNIISEAFLKPLRDGGYTGRSIALVNTVIGEQGDLEEWRSLTYTNTVRATLGQVSDATKRWMNKPEYLAATGFSIRIELE